MKASILFTLNILFSLPSFCQQIISGDYDAGLKLSYDRSANRLTGYFEEYTGWDEEEKAPRFSCIFYIEGIVTGKTFNIDTYYPGDKSEDLIKGTIQIINDSIIRIILPEEHGGCWNVHHFAGEPSEFKLLKPQPWQQTRYVDTERAYFYSGKSDEKKQKAYVVRGNFVSIKKVEEQWAYCTYYGKKITTGWMKLADLNRL